MPGYYPTSLRDSTNTHSPFVPHMPIEQADLMEVVRTVWETVLEICLVPTETPPSWSATERLLGNVGISGEWTGVVVVEATIPAARDAACRMFKLENEKLTPDDL